MNSLPQLMKKIFPEFSNQGVLNIKMIYKTLIVQPYQKK